jgi:hypothetical protein
MPMPLHLAQLVRRIKLLGVLGYAIGRVQDTVACVDRWIMVRFGDRYER